MSLRKNVFPVLKRRIEAKDSPNIDNLYHEHRALDLALNRLQNELDGALKTNDCASFRSQIMSYAQELIDSFYVHGRNERAAFIKAGKQ